MELMNKLLTNQSLEAGGVTLENIPYRIDTVMEEVIDMLSVKANPKGRTRRKRE